MTRWLHDLVAGFTEVRDLREAVVLAVRERDRARDACVALARDNVRLAARLERSELVVEQADRIITAYAGPVTLAEWNRFLADHEQVPS